jgi:nucleoid-associated protein YgaU
MATGTRVFLAVFALLVGALVLYYTTILAPDRPPIDLAATELAEIAPAVPERAEAREPAAAPPAAIAPEAPVASPFAAAPPAQTEILMGAAAPQPLERTAPSVAPPPASEPTAAAAAHDYVIQPGDSLSSIAAQWFGDDGLWDLIAAANPQLEPHRLRPGDLIRLPPPDARRQARTVPGGSGTYVVASGDTLSDIARSVYGQSSRWAEIFEANRELLQNDPHRLKVGMTLRIP